MDGTPMKKIGKMDGALIILQDCVDRIILSIDTSYNMDSAMTIF